MKNRVQIDLMNKEIITTEHKIVHHKAMADMHRTFLAALKARIEILMEKPGVKKDE